MKRPTAGARKKVTAENLVALGAERLAEVLLGVAETRPDLKRRLRMELAAEQGADHLVAEVDRRLNTLGTSRGHISWRQRPAFARDLAAVRELIGVRLADLDRGAALTRLWTFLTLWSRVSGRVRDREGAVAQPFVAAARDLGRLLGREDIAEAASALVGALQQAPSQWTTWLPAVLENLPPATADRALPLVQQETRPATGWLILARQLADAASDAVAYRETFSTEALRTPQIAAQVARRDLAAGRLSEAGELLRASAPAADRHGRLAAPDFDWEGVWIDYLEASGASSAAQAVRWASFERTLAADRARDIIVRLPDFEDVEAEARVFDIAAAHADAGLAVRLLMDWPSFPAAARLIEARGDDLQLEPEDAELWSARLRRRFPAAAHRLLRRGAALAFRRREYQSSTRLTEEADSIDLPRR